MKALSILLSIVVVLLVALIAFFFIGGTLGAQAHIVAVPAQEQPEAFAAAAEAVQTGHAPRAFAQMEGDDPAAYTLVDITASLKNNGLFAAEWATFTIEPGEGDVAVYSQSVESLDIAPRSGAETNFKVLARGNGAGRTLRVEYYVLGMRRTVSLSIDSIE